MSSSPSLRHVRRLEYLDSVRGMAALFVFFSHYMSAFNVPPQDGALVPAIIDRGPLAVYQDGFAAVTIFLVLSGYVLSLKFWKAPSISFRREILPFYANRLMRIFPPFLAALGICALLYPLRVPDALNEPIRSVWYQAHWTTPISWETFLRQAFLFIPTVSDSHRWIPMDWTLTTELNISFLIPFLIMIAAACGPYLLVFAFVAIFLLKMHGFIFHFSLGILLAQKNQELTAWWADRGGGTKMMVLAAAFVLYSARTWFPFVPGHLLLKESWLWYVTGAGAFLFLVAVTGSARLQRWLSFPALVWLGKISYSVYLLHFAVIMALAPIVLRILPQTTPAAFWAGLSTNTLVVVLVSTASYWIVEKPSMRLARRLFG